MKDGDRGLHALDPWLAPSLVLERVGGEQLIRDCEVSVREADFDELAKCCDVAVGRHAFSYSSVEHYSIDVE